MAYLLSIPEVKVTINHRRSDGTTALHRAAEQGHLGVVKVLVRNQANCALLNNVRSGSAAAGKAANPLPPVWLDQTLFRSCGPLNRKGKPRTIEPRRRANATSPSFWCAAFTVCPCLADQTNRNHPLQKAYMEGGDGASLNSEVGCCGPCSCPRYPTWLFPHLVHWGVGVGWCPVNIGHGQLERNEHGFCRPQSFLVLARFQEPPE